MSETAGVFSPNNGSGSQIGVGTSWTNPQNFDLVDSDYATVTGLAAGVVMKKLFAQAQIVRGEDIENGQLPDGVTLVSLTLQVGAYRTSGTDTGHLIVQMCHANQTTIGNAYSFPASSLPTAVGAQLNNVLGLGELGVTVEQFQALVDANDIGFLVQVSSDTGGGVDLRCSANGFQMSIEFNRPGSGGAAMLQRALLYATFGLDPDLEDDPIAAQEALLGLGR